jgi:hypothetical protein
MNYQNPRLCRSLLAACVAIGTVCAGGLLAAPAGAAGGLVLTNATSHFDSVSSKSVRVDCPAGMQVVGGGSDIPFSGVSVANRVRLVELRPVHNNNGPDGYVAVAKEVDAAVTDDWELDVYAVCSDPIPGLYLAGGSGPAGSATVQSADAVCAPGSVALGGGGLVRNAGFQADLRTVAPSQTGDRFTAVGGEDVDGYDNSWSMVAYAICAPRPPGYQIHVETNPGSPTASRKAFTSNCPAGTRLRGSGVATDPTAGGGIGLEQVFPQTQLTATQALAVATEPITADWGPIQVFAICAT